MLQPLQLSSVKFAARANSKAKTTPVGSQDKGETQTLTTRFIDAYINYLVSSAINNDVTYFFLPKSKQAANKLKSDFLKDQGYKGLDDPKLKKLPTEKSSELEFKFLRRILLRQDIPGFTDLKNVSPSSQETVATKYLQNCLGSYGNATSLSNQKRQQLMETLIKSGKTSVVFNDGKNALLFTKFRVEACYYEAGIKALETILSDPIRQENIKRVEDMLTYGFRGRPKSASTDPFSFNGGKASTLPAYAQDVALDQEFSNLTKLFKNPKNVQVAEVNVQKSAALKTRSSQIITAKLQLPNEQEAHVKLYLAPEDPAGDGVEPNQLLKAYFVLSENGQKKLWAGLTDWNDKNMDGVSLATKKTTYRSKTNEIAALAQGFFNRLQSLIPSKSVK